jgi:potassium-transporting ATPase potassium-binding subunit
MWNDIVINLAIIAIIVATSLPLGRYIWKVFTDQRTWLDRVLGPVERLVLRVTGASTVQQDWRAYCVSLLASNVVMWVIAYALLTLQAHLPLTTNTNLQHYSGETGLSTFSQLFVIVWLQFVTAATGIAACVAVFRGLAGSRLTTLGNFYQDCTRAAVRVLLPFALPVAAVTNWSHTITNNCENVESPVSPL